MLKEIADYYIKSAKISLQFAANASSLVLENAGRITYNLFNTCSITAAGVTYYNLMQKLNEGMYKLADNTADGLNTIGNVLSIQRLPHELFNFATNTLAEGFNFIFNIDRYFHDKFSETYHHSTRMHDMNKEMTNKWIADNNECLKYALCIMSAATILTTLYNSHSEESVKIKKNIKKNINNFYSLQHKLFASLFGATDKKNTKLSSNNSTDKTDTNLDKNLNEIQDTEKDTMKNSIKDTTEDLEKKIDDIKDNPDNLKINLDDMINNSVHTVKDLSDKIITVDSIIELKPDIQELHNMTLEDTFLDFIGEELFDY